MESLLFNILDSVDSTNNYAMARVHEGMAMHGQAWFAHHQEKGKGQRGKVWESLPGENLILSVVLRPPRGYDLSKFHFHALVAVTVATFLEQTVGQPVAIKWPNDLFFGDRKAGGILIENTIQGNEWKWSVVGVGINVNQVRFPGSVPNAVSLFQLTGERFDPVELARTLHRTVVMAVDAAPPATQWDQLIAIYNERLYMRGKAVRLKSGNRVFSPVIKGVDALGQLVTTDVFETAYRHGEVEWLKSG